MRSRKVSWILPAVLACGLLSAAKTVAAEEKKEVSGPLPKEQKEFFEKTQRLNSLNTRIEEAEKQFQALVKLKSEEKNSDEKQRIIKQMVEATKDRNKSAEEYNKVRAELSLRYPNQGEHLDRRYQTQTKKSVEELEGAAGLDELLTRTKKIVEKKFAPFADPEETKKQAKTKVQPQEEEKPERLKLEK